jgi:hypothetical protein
MAAPIPRVFEDVFRRIDAIDWVEISRGADGATFPSDLRAYFSAKTAKARAGALDTIWEKLADAPLGALAAKFLVELLAHPREAGDVPRLCQLLVAMMTSDHRNWLVASFDVKEAPFVLSRANKWNAIAERREVLLSLLHDDDALVCANTAFVLAWLGSTHSNEIVPHLEELTSDPSALVRASALLALGLHGRPSAFAKHERSEGPVVLAAALAETFATNAELSDRALAALGRALEEETKWPELPWCRGDLGAFALRRVLHLDDRYDARTRPWLLAQLDGPLAADVVVQLIERTFPKGEPIEPLDETKLELLRAIGEHPKTHTAACNPLRDAGLPVGDSRLVHHQIDAVRKFAKLPRPAPATPPFADVTHEGDTRAAQHWLSDFSEQGRPEARSLARSIATQVPASDLVQLLLMSGDYETDLYDGPIDEAFHAPSPEGGEPRAADGALVFPHERWPDRARAFLERLRGDGWLVASEWWFGSAVRVIAHREGCAFWFEMGNDWNAGNPIVTESRFLAKRQFSVAPLVAEEAALSCAGFEAALLERVATTPKGQLGLAWASRLVNIALWAWGPRHVAPPRGMDEAAIAMQAFWTYVTGPFRAYAEMLDEERREALVLSVFERTHERLPLLYGIAPTSRVLEAVTAQAKRELAQWGDRRDAHLELWRRDIGEHADALHRACT